MDLSELLSTHRAEIVAAFVARVQRADVPPPEVRPASIVDHIPRFLDDLAALLAPAKRDADDAVEHARLHGEQRWSLGYDLNALIREYGILRECILSVAKAAAVAVTVDEVTSLVGCIEVGIAAAATEYVKLRDDERDGHRTKLEFLAAAGTILSSSLDYRSTLNRLTRLVVPRLADWCAIHLRGSSVDDVFVTHVDPARTELLRALYRTDPASAELLRGELRVLDTGEPELVHDASPAPTDQVERSPKDAASTRVTARSWLIVPLRAHGHVLGTMTLCYEDSPRRYEESDLTLATELARSAAAAIDNAQLYELSQQARSRADVATHAKDEFVAMVSHELRTPLSVIVGWIPLLRSSELPDERREHAYVVMERNADALSRLVTDLLDVSQVITGKIRLNLAQVDLSNVVDMVVEGVRFAADSKRITLEVDIDRNNAVIRADGDRLQQVLGNLVSNAIKFTPKNGVVKIGLARVRSDLELSVEDNGEGIAPRFLPHVFEAFRQEEGGLWRRHGGLGLGLSIAKHLVDIHGGTIDATSAGPGKGSRFVVRLPIGPLASGTIGVTRIPATQTPPVSDKLPSLRGVRVLVIDDERDARELIALVLETCEVEVRVAAGAAEAMTALETFAPHVIVCDIGMPNEDGYTLIRRIRTLAAEDKKDIPAVALTGLAQNESRTRALVEGFNAYLTKPIEPLALVQAVVELSGVVQR
ncbi:MAG: ATP-binding protein [Polyangia bacterium]